MSTEQEIKDSIEIGEMAVKEAVAATKDVPVPSKSKSSSKKPRRRYTRCLLTFNTNQKYNEDTPELNERHYESLKNAVAAIFAAIKRGELITYLDGCDKSCIQDVKYTVGVIERGEIEKRIHLHGILNIAHMGKIRLDNSSIQALLNDKLGYTGYFNNQYMNNSISTMLDYINKNMKVDDSIYPNSAVDDFRGSTSSTKAPKNVVDLTELMEQAPVEPQETQTPKVMPKVVPKKEFKTEPKILDSVEVEKKKEEEEVPVWRPREESKPIPIVRNPVRPQVRAASKQFFLRGIFGSLTRR